jgi:hypothetical protein
VARSRSSQRCNASSRSDDGVPNATSAGPHKKNSSTDFTCDREMARSWWSRSLISGVRAAVTGRRSCMAVSAHWQRDPSSLAGPMPSTCRIQSLGCGSRSSRHSTKFDNDKGPSSMPCAWRVFSPFTSCSNTKLPSLRCSSSGALLRSIVPYVCMVSTCIWFRTTTYAATKFTIWLKSFKEELLWGRGEICCEDGLADSTYKIEYFGCLVSSMNYPECFEHWYCRFIPAWELGECIFYVVIMLSLHSLTAMEHVLRLEETASRYGG